MTTTEITSVTTDVIKGVVIEKLLTNIVKKFPRDVITITIQLDGDGDHSINDDKYVKREFLDSGLNIKLEKKPPQGPEVNVLYLGYFTSIQELHHKKGCKNVDDLVSKVISSYEELEPSKLINIWFTLKLVMLEIIKVKGYNMYVLPPHKQIVFRKVR